MTRLLLGRATVIAGADARAVTVITRRAGDGTWDIEIAGTAPALQFRAGASDSLGLTVSVGREGQIAVRLADGVERESRIAAAASAPVPPYELAFAGEPAASACAVVWWEIARP